MSTGKIIADCRKKNGLTQEQLAEEIHTSRQTIAMWETGKTASIRQRRHPCGSSAAD